VRRRPVDALAAGAPGKILLGGINISRYELFNGLFWPDLKCRIALKAAAKKLTSELQSALADNLAQLIAVMVTFDENKLRRLFLFEAPVAGENQAPISPCRANQTISGQVWAINHVTANYAQPFHQPAEHAIGGELDLRGTRLTGFFRFRH